MDITNLKDGDKLRIIRCHAGSPEYQWGFRAGMEVTVTAQRSCSDQPDGTVAVKNEHGMLGYFEPEDVMVDPVVGDRVRAHDFNNVGEARIMGRPPCYVEGIIRAIVNGDCRRYDIEIERRMWDGHYDTAEKGQSCLTPVNGTEGTFSGVLFRVEKI